MSRLHQSLNDQVNWVRCLEALDVEVSIGSLPWGMPCPFCSTGRLSILTDKLSGGQWHWCADCGVRGDMIEFAARMLDRSVESAVRQLCQWGLLAATDAQITRYVEDYVDYRKALLSFWQDARMFNAKLQAEVDKTMRRYSLDWDDDISRWLIDGPGRYFGACHVNDAADVLQRHRWSSEFQPRGKQSFFAKPPWGYTLVFPFFDLPGRISSMLFVGEPGHSGKDEVLRRTRIARILRQVGVPNFKEVGLYFDPESITDAIADNGDKIIVLDRAQTVARLQLKHAKDSERRLPLVAWFPGDGQSTNTAWDMFSETQKIYWAPSLAPVQIREAARTDSHVSTVGPKTGSLKKYMGSHSNTIVDLCLRDHCHWTEAIADYLAPLTAREAQEKLLEINLNTELADQLLRTLPAPLKDYAEQVLRQKVRTKQILVNSTTITERRSGWYADRQRGEELIMNGCLRISRVITQKKARRVFYEGYVSLGDDRMDFCVPKDVFDNKPMSWLQNKVAETGKFFLTINDTWDKHLLTIATQLHPPEAVVGMDSVGWNEDEDRFDFPTYSIAAGGFVASNDSELLPEHMPCQNWPDTEHPPAMSGKLVSPITALTHATQDVVWALLAGVIANVISPIFREKTTGIGLCGLGAARAGKTLAKLVGCDSRHITGATMTASDTKEAVAATEEERRHNWPLYVDCDSGARSFFRWVHPANNPYFTHNAIAPLNWHYAAVLQMFGGWVIIDQPKRTKLSPMAGLAASRIVPSYLHNLCERRFVLAESDDTSWFGCVLNDLATFVERFVDLPHDIRHAVKIVSPDCGEAGRPEMFVRLVAQLEKDRELTVLRSEQGVVIPKYRLNKVLENHMAHLPDTGDVSELLQSVGVLINDELTWEVDAEWWDEQVARVKPQTKTSLKLYG